MTYITHQAQKGKLLTERDIWDRESEWGQHLSLLHDRSCRSINRWGSSPQLCGTVHRYSLAVDILCRFPGALNEKTLLRFCSNGFRQNVSMFFVAIVTLSGGLASTGAPRTPPARLFFRFSWTWVSCSSRSTLSASFTRQASSSSDTRLVIEDFLLPTTQTHKD